MNWQLSAALILWSVSVGNASSSGNSADDIAVLNIRNLSAVPMPASMQAPTRALTAHLNGYTHIYQGCVDGHNIGMFTSGSTVQECAAHCDAVPSCVAFEFGVAHGGGSGSYSPGDCQLKSSSNSDCDGSDWNLDLYTKENCLDAKWTNTGWNIYGNPATCAELQPWCDAETIGTGIQSKCPVTCGVCQDEGSIRLVGRGSSNTSGRLEIYRNREWGTVCGDDFEDSDAQVVCQQLGLSGGTRVDINSFGQGTGPIWLDNLACSGSEATLSSCSHSGWGEHNCGHHEDVAIQCEAPRMKCHVMYLMADTNLDGDIARDLQELAGSAALKNPLYYPLVFIDRVDNASDYHSGNAPQGLLGADGVTPAQYYSGVRYIEKNFTTNYLTVAGELGEHNSDDPATVQAFLTWAFSRCRAKDANSEVMLHFGSHGDGWRGFGFDDSAGANGMRNGQLRTAIQASMAAASPPIVRLSLLGFDACLMQSYAAMSVFADLTEWYLASEELEPGHGWNYFTIDPALSVKNMAIEIANSFAHGLHRMEEHQTPKTLAVFRSSDFSHFQESMDALFTQMSDGLTDAVFKGTVVRARQLTKPLQKDGSADLLDFLNNYQAECTSCNGVLTNAIAQAKSRFQTMVAHGYFARGPRTDTKLNGMGIWFPVPSNIRARFYIESLLAGSNGYLRQDDQAWLRFMDAFVPTAYSIGMVHVEMDGWCGPDAGLLSTSTYPGCIDECAAQSNCNAVRYVKESNVCNLMSACTITNEDSRWRHATKPGNRRLGLSPHGERRLVGGVDIDYTITPQQIANWTAEAEPSSNKLEDDDGASVGKHLPVLV